jgi:hypothetical protein
MKPSKKVWLFLHVFRIKGVVSIEYSVKREELNAV